MLDFSLSELAVIGTIALVVLGPERLPSAARTAGQWVSKVRRFASQMQQELTSQLDTEELRKEFAEHQKMLDQQMQETRQALIQVQDDARSALSEDVTPSPKAPRDRYALDEASFPSDYQPAYARMPESSALTDIPRPVIAALALRPPVASSAAASPDMMPRNTDES